MQLTTSTMRRAASAACVGLLAMGLALHVQHVAATPDDKPARSDLPKAEDLIKAAIEAQGGKEAFDEIESTILKATMSTMMGNVELESHSRKTGEFFIKQTVPGMGEMRSGYNGKVGWVHNPMMGYQLLEESDLEDMREMTTLHQLVPRLKKEFTSIETVDKTSFAGKDCYKVRMVHKRHEQEQFAYFDAAERLIIGIEVEQDGGMGPMTVTMRFEDWKQYDDLKVFSKMHVNQMGMEMTMEITELKFNAVDAKVFELPDEVKRLAQQREEQQSDESPDND